MDLTFLGLGGHTESLPTWPSTSEIKEAKWGQKRTEKKTKIYGSTKIKLIQTSMEDKLLREEAEKEREQKWYLLGLFFFFLYRRVKEDATEITLMMLFFYLLGPLPPSSFKLWFRECL